MPLLLPPLDNGYHFPLALVAGDEHDILLDIPPLTLLSPSRLSVAAIHVKRRPPATIFVSENPHKPGRTSHHYDPDILRPRSLISPVHTDTPLLTSHACVRSYLLHTFLRSARYRDDLLRHPLSSEGRVERVKGLASQSLVYEALEIDASSGDITRDQLLLDCGL
jgi:hypothetical protein